MSKERELLKECRLMLDNPINGTAGRNLQIRITELIAQPEGPEDIYNEGFKANMVELRDHFAGMAMQGILTTLSKTVNSDSVAQMAYNMADAMLKEREKRDEQKRLAAIAIKQREAHGIGGGE